MAAEITVISLGGSLIVPDKINIEFLKEFRDLILEQIEKNKRFIVITGGGKTARNYQKAASTIVNLTEEDLDWLGIHSTRLNAHLLRTIFRDIAHPKLVKNPNEDEEFNEYILVASGWKPGCSTDYDAALLAKTYGVKTIINMTNVEYVYDKDPSKFKDSKPIKKTSWKDFRKIVGNEWDPGLNLPFDPVASRKAQELGLKVIIIGPDLKNLENFLDGKKFKGTEIE